MLPGPGDRQMVPLRIGERTERRGHGTDVRFELRQGLEPRILADIGADALEGRFRDQRADVVDDQLADRRIGASAAMRGST